MAEVIKKSKVEVIDLIQIALFAAMTYVATRLIEVPYNVLGIGPSGLVHLGDSVVFIAAILLGKRKAAIAAAIGMTLFDLTSPYAIWAPVTFIAKGGMAYICGLIAYSRGKKGDGIFNNIIATVVSGIWMILIYLIGGIIITLLTVDSVTLSLAVYTNILNISGNVIQIIAGMVVALPISTTLAKALPKAGIALNK